MPALFDVEIAFHKLQLYQAIFNFAKQPDGEGVLTLSVQQIAKLKRIIALAEKLVAESPKTAVRNGAAKKQKQEKRQRRSGKELVQFRRMLKAERKKGVAVAELARKHHVSSAYIYMLP